jgi:hypothetical protein
MSQRTARRGLPSLVPAPSFWCWVVNQSPDPGCRSLLRPISASLRVVAFDTEGGGIDDVTAEVARQVVSCAIESEHELPAAVRDFVKRAGA